MVPPDHKAVPIHKKNANLPENAKDNPTSCPFCSGGDPTAVTLAINHFYIKWP